MKDGGNGQIKEPLLLVKNPFLAGAKEGVRSLLKLVKQTPTSVVYPVLNLWKMKGSLLVFLVNVLEGDL